MFSTIPKEQATSSREGGCRLRVLVVDDEQDLIILLSIMLDWIGCIPESAASCNEALQKAVHSAYDVILLDYYLPDGTGTDLLARIRDLQPDADIVTMTGKNSREVELQCRAQSIIYHLVKPFEFRELISLLNHAARRRAKARKCA